MHGAGGGGGGNSSVQVTIVVMAQELFKHDDTEVKQVRDFSKNCFSIVGMFDKR